jgi:hypothetical protein
MGIDDFCVHVHQSYSYRGLIDCGVVIVKVKACAAASTSRITVGLCFRPLRTIGKESETK